MLKPMKLFERDIIYQQGEYAEEIFFIVQGRVKMYVDLAEHHDDEPIFLPYNLYVAGCYFGDVDIFSNSGPFIRDSTAIAAMPTQLLVITRKEISDLCNRFKRVNVEMVEVAAERKKHHLRGIAAARERLSTMTEEERVASDWRHFTHHSAGKEEDAEIGNHKKDFGSEHVEKKMKLRAKFKGEIEDAKTSVSNML